MGRQAMTLRHRLHAAWDSPGEHRGLLIGLELNEKRQSMRVLGEREDRRTA